MRRKAYLPSVAATPSHRAVPGQALRKLRRDVRHVPVGDDGAVERAHDVHADGDGRAAVHDVGGRGGRRRVVVGARGAGRDLDRRRRGRDRRGERHRARRRRGERAVGVHDRHRAGRGAERHAHVHGGLAPHGGRGGHVVLHPLGAEEHDLVGLRERLPAHAQERAGPNGARRAAARRAGELGDRRRAGRQRRGQHDAWETRDRVGWGWARRRRPSARAPTTAPAAQGTRTTAYAVVRRLRPTIPLFVRADQSAKRMNSRRWRLP